MVNFKLVLFSTSCLYLLAPASSTSLLAAAKAAGTAKAAIVGAGIKALLTKGTETVIVNEQPGVVIETIPVPVVVPPTTIFSGVGSIWSKICNAISAKTRAVGAFLTALKAPQQVIVLVPNTTTTTTTTTTPSTTTTSSTTQKPVIVEVIVHEKERYGPLAVPLIY